MAEPRRSGRERKANPKYANDGWDKDVLRKLRESSESSGSSPVDDVSELGDGRVLDDEEDDVSLVQVASGGSSDAEMLNEDDGDLSMASVEDETRPFKPVFGGTPRSRGGPLERDPAAAAAVAYPDLFRPEVDDLADALKARDAWLKDCDITIPSRQTLSTAIEQSKYMGETCAEDDERAQPEVQDASLVSSPFLSLSKNQVLKPIKKTECYEKYLLSDRPSHSVVLGPCGAQKKYALEYLSSLDFGEAWMKECQSPRETTAANKHQPVQERYHEGWLLNMGEKVQCLAWAPCPGPIQYLAVAVRCTSKQRRTTPVAGDRHSAFQPSPPYPSAIQIWAFQTDNSSVNGFHTLSMKNLPRLAIVLATAWGNIRQLKWSPREQATGNGDDDSGSLLGHLGVMSSDGHARVIGVPLPPENETADTSILLVDRAGLDLPRPENSIFTTLSFASPTDLLLGTADGYVHLHTLCEHQNHDEPRKSSLQQQPHHAYVVSLCSASLGPNSTFAATASASGDFALTDLRIPETDRVIVPRTCFPIRDLVYMPFTRSFVAVLDRSENGQIDRNATTFLVCHHIRQFPTLVKLAKLPRQNGSATALAGSKWHPCILVGNAKGQVLATNYLRRVLPDPKTDQGKAAGAYLQRICEYDWRPLTQVELSEDACRSSEEAGHEEEVDLFHGHDVRSGMSRFHEGFKPEKIEVGNFHSSGRKAKKKHKEELPGEAVFEEEQAATVIDWNPNAVCAGVVAIGWGSGIVRVQDLAYDNKEP